MVAESARKRKPWTRSRRGCRTCRLRHVKCDETYPACKRCSSTGRTCDGCSRPSGEWEVATVSSMSSSPERRPFHQDEEAESCFAYFQYRTADYLESLVDRQWKHLVLRAAEHNEAIYHAIVAIGSMHKTVLSSRRLSAGLDDDKYAIKQYTHALRLLASKSDGGQIATADIALAACILFVGFENLRRNYGVVLEHVRSGISILQQHQHDPHRVTGDHMIPIHQLLPAFARLARQAHELTGDGSAFMQGLAAAQTAAGFFNYADTDPRPIPRFDDLAHAWASLHQIWHAAIACMDGAHYDWFNHMGDVHRAGLRREQNESREQQILGFKRELRTWSLGLEELKGRIIDPSVEATSIQSLLECYMLLIETVIGTTSFRSHGMIWDEYRDHFRRMLDLCRSVVELEAQASNELNSARRSISIAQRYNPNVRTGEAARDERESSPFSEDARCPLTFDMSLCMVLVHVITKCRDARIRLEAINLLEEYPRLEGLWDSAIITKIGWAIDAVERRGASLVEAAAREAPAAEISLLDRVLHIRGAWGKHSRTGEVYLLQCTGESELTFNVITKSIDW